MSGKKKGRQARGISRREFLKDAGVIVSGAVIGPTMLMAACKGETTTVTSTTTLPGETTTTTVTPPAAVEGFITLRVNGEDYQLKVKPEWTLTFVLREKLGLSGTKVGCNRGECGTCTIIVDGRPVYACIVLAVEADGHDILTIEGLPDGYDLHPVQKLFLENETFQCGYCTPGNIMSAVALLNKTPKPTLQQVKQAMSGNLCMCGDTTRIVNTVLKGV
jgi:xanthine dehydrogenase YagT iron-sulfur-binding subunit